MAPFTRPEAVLRRADELSSIGQDAAALESICEIFTSRKFRPTPLTVLEPILLRFVQLSVALNKSRTVKEGILLYKNLAQNQNVASVQKVVEELISLSQAKLDKAIASISGEGVEKDLVEDLDAVETPESILLGAVSTIQTKDRGYRTTVMPALRFLWDAYRSSLDVLRNNSRLESLYHTITLQAFDFCLTHGRKTEFRRLSEMLRSHLSSVQKFANQPHSINLDDPKTLQRYLDLRFRQLEVASELQLYQEAFRTADDIHSLLALSKRAPKVSVLVAFYEKMAQVFLVGGNGLFHAAALGKVFQLQLLRYNQASTSAKTDDAPSEQMLESLAKQVLLSALAVPLSNSAGLAHVGNMDEGEARGKVQKLTNLLGLTSAPSRESLLVDALSRNVTSRLSAEFLDLHKALEKSFHPHTLTRSVEPILKSFLTEHSLGKVYVRPLKQIILAKLVGQLSQVYSSVQIEKIVSLAKFSDEFTALETQSFEKPADEFEVAYSDEIDVERIRVESFLVDVGRRGEFQLEIDHAESSVRFLDRVLDSEFEPQGDAIQCSLKEVVQTHLSVIAETLYKSLATTYPSHAPATTARLTASRLVPSQNPSVQEAIAAERTLLIARKEILVQRASEKSARLARLASEAQAMSLEEARKRKEEEERKRKEQLALIQQERIKKEIEDSKRKEADKLIKALVEKTGQKLVAQEKTEDMSAEKILQLGVQHIEKEKKDMSTKLSAISKRMDHLERAFRLESIPHLGSDYAKQNKLHKEIYDSMRGERVEIARAEHGVLLAKKKVYQKFKDSIERVSEERQAGAKKAWERRMVVMQEELAIEKAKRVQEYEAAKRAEEEERERLRAEEEARLKAEEVARQAEEAARLEAEASKRKLEEAAEARRREREEERQKDLEIAKLRMAREEAAMAKQAGPAPVGSAAWKANRGSSTLDSAPSSRKPLNLAGRTIPLASDSPAPTSNTPTPTSALNTASASNSASQPIKAGGMVTGISVSDTTANTWKPSAGAGGWRARMAEKEKVKPDGDDGFQTVKRGTVGLGSGTAYRPPARR